FKETALERAVRDPEQLSRMLAPRKKNQIVWRGSERPMLLKTTPYFEYFPYWYFSRDKEHREKWRSRFWRFGRRDPDVNQPGRPPDGDYRPSPDDIVPGTEKTWGDVIENYRSKGGDDMREDLPNYMKVKMPEKGSQPKKEVAKPKDEPKPEQALVEEKP